MKKNLLRVLALAVVLSLVVACSTPTPTPLPPVPASSKSSESSTAATRVPSTTTPVPSTATAVLPIATPVSATKASEPKTLEPTKALVPTETPQVSVVPGLYVADVRVEPARPAFNQNVSFFVTFDNTDSKPLVFNWKLLVYCADIVTKSDNETSIVNTAFASGRSEIAALGSYKYGATSRTCESFFISLVWLDSNSKATEFTTTEGKVFEKSFQICDAATIATDTPVPVQPTSTTVAPGSGLFVTSMRLDPAQPGHNQDIIFYPTFNNTSGIVQNYAWKVFVYNAASPASPVLDTTSVQGAFATGTTTEGKAGSTYRFGATGNQCDYFFARVGFLEGDKRVFFMSADGKTFEKGFSICN